MRVPIVPGGLFNSLAENRTPAGRAYSGSNFSVDGKIWECSKRYVLIGQRPSPNAADVCWGLGYGAYTCSDIQSLTVSGSPTAGTATMRFNGHDAVLNWNTTASDAQASLGALSDFGDGEIFCYGGPWPAQPIYAVFRGRYAGAPQSLFTLQTNNLTGGSSPTVSVAHFVTGGAAEEYLVVIQPSGAGTSTLYKVTSSDGFATTTWTSVATGLTSSNWLFRQFNDRIYAINPTDGILYKQLGGNWSGAASNTTTLAPPLVAPSVTTVFTSTGYDDLPLSAVDFTGASYAQTGFTSAPTMATGSNKSAIKVTLAANENGSVVTLTATLAADKDWSYEDFWRAVFSITTSGDVFIDPNSINMEFINDDGSPLTITPPNAMFPTGTSSSLIFYKYLLFGSDSRSTRDNIKKIKFSFTVTGASGKIFFIQPTMFGNWLNNTTQTIDTINGPTRKSIEYAYSYFQTSTGSETKLSPLQHSLVVPASSLNGAWIQVSASGRTSLLNTDFIYFYRRDRFGQWRRFATASNTAAGTTVSVYDKYMLDELDNFTEIGTVSLPGGFLPSVIEIWQDCMVVGADRKIWISHVGKPLYFAPDPDLFAETSQLDITDAANPRTAYMARNRAESVSALVGQEALYASGPYTGYAMTGGNGNPNSLSPPRPLPGSRGCLGARSGCRQSGGALLPAASGLWYYAVSAGFSGVVAPGTLAEEEISIDVRKTWKDIFGAAPSNAVTVSFNEEIYAFSGARYIKFTRNKQVESGTLANAMLAAEPNQTNGFVWVTPDGKLMKMSDTLLTDNGTTVAWSWVSGILDGPRTRLKQIEVEYSGSPYIIVEFWDGNAFHDSQRFDLAAGDGSVNYYPVDMPIQGYRYRITIGGIGGDHVDDLNFEFEDATKGGKGN